MIEKACGVGLGGGSGAISANSALDPDNLEPASPSRSGKDAMIGGDGVMTPRLSPPGERLWAELVSSNGGVGLEPNGGNRTD